MILINNKDIHTYYTYYTYDIVFKSKLFTVSYFLIVELWFSYVDVKTVAF